MVDLPGAEDLVASFNASHNQGIEGACVAPRDAGLLLVREGNPRILIQVSDEIDCVLLYDLDADIVLRRFVLTYRTETGTTKTIKSAEGVVHARDGDRLFIASDSNRAIYEYRV